MVRHEESPPFSPKGGVERSEAGRFYYSADNSKIYNKMGTYFENVPRLPKHIDPTGQSVIRVIFFL